MNAGFKGRVRGAALLFAALALCACGGSLQVMRNPGWLLPYLACGLMTVGLLVQFGIHLTGFFRKRAAAPAR